MKSTFKTYHNDIPAGIIITILIIIIQTYIMGTAIIFLDIGLVISLFLWIAHIKKDKDTEIIKIYFIALGIQCLHFLEEFFTGFQNEFPVLFGYTWSDEQFAAFN